MSLSIQHIERVTLTCAGYCRPKAKIEAESLVPIHTYDKESLALSEVLTKAAHNKWEIKDVSIKNTHRWLCPDCIKQYWNEGIFMF